MEMLENLIENISYVVDALFSSQLAIVPYFNILPPALTLAIATPLSVAIVYKIVGRD